MVVSVAAMGNLPIADGRVPMSLARAKGKVKSRSVLFVSLRKFSPCHRRPRRRMTNDDSAPVRAKSRGYREALALCLTDHSLDAQNERTNCQSRPCAGFRRT
jgi:hypothetical protein